MASLTDRVDMLFAEWDRDDSPGCVLAVIRDGEIAHARGYGMADLERGIRITPQSVFDLGSTGKQFTAAVIAILANQERLSLDDSIRRHLPEMPDYANGITIRHLVHHTGGLRDYLTLLDAQGLPHENIYAEEYLYGLIAAQKRLNFKPGAQVLYSNSGYFLLGYIAGRITGRHITDLIREHILEPLGMRHTTFNKHYGPIVKDRALSYDDGEDKGSFTNEIALCGGFGDGAVMSNVEDLLLWDRNFYGNRLNNAQSDLVEQLHSLGQLNDGRSFTYAFGLVVDDYRGLKRVSHGGSWAGYRTEMMRFPDERLTVICISNLGSIDPTGLCCKVADIHLEQIMDDRPADGPAPSDADLENFTGVYRGKYRTMELLLRDGRLCLLVATREYSLQQVGRRGFQLGEGPEMLTFSGKDNKHLHFREYGIETERYDRIRSARQERQELSIYAGAYRCRELDATYNIYVHDDGLQLKRNPYDAPSPLTVLTEDTLVGSIGELRFRTGRGIPTGFALNADRAVKLKFERLQ